MPADGFIAIFTNLITIIMNNFKLIAITPLLGCNTTFSKNLTLGTPFRFYKKYEITVDPKKDQVIRVLKNENYDEAQNIFTLKNGIAVDFSAVAGKNGSGKSTLFELFYYVIYLLATRAEMGEKAILSKAFEDLEELRAEIFKDLHTLGNGPIFNVAAAKDGKPAAEKNNPAVYLLEVIQKYGLDYRISQRDTIEDLYKILQGSLILKNSALTYETDREKEKEGLLDKEFNVSLIYEADGLIREVHCVGGRIIHNEFKEDNSGIKEPLREVFSLDSFFYTISLNYSHHSLNSKTLGLWIRKLFHKNDAYRTPVVINPMRTEGNFNINDELNLSRERLISTLAYDLVTSPGASNKLLGKYRVSKYIFTLKKVFDDYSYTELEDTFILEKTKLENMPTQAPYWETAVRYLAKKSQKIADKYGFLIEKGKDGTAELDKYLSIDDSHVTRKIDQTFNFLRVSNTEGHAEIWGKTGEYSEIELSPAELKRYIDLFGDETKDVAPEDIIKYALPGFFNIDFEFLDDNDAPIKLSELSSGEQQSIFNINAILYHLYNIESVHPKKNSEAGSFQNPKRPQYSKVNIVLDEVELYYHPQMQRALVSDLMDAFENLRPSSAIRAINVCILTHSPFILSDIPALNVLLLERDEKGLSIVRENKAESFAANINDLLADNFFLEDTLIGDYAAERIELLIERIKNKTPDSGDDGLIELIGDPYLKTTLKTFKENYDSN